MASMVEVSQVMLASGASCSGIPTAAQADMVVILGDLALILVLARAVGWLFSRLHQPAVLGEILAGVLLGPTILGPKASEWLFPQDERAYLTLLANLGLVLFMFIVGLELDIGLVRGREKVAASVSATSIVLPFALGIGLAVFLPNEYDAPFWPFALFIGAAISITAFPVLARILTERNMHRTETGALALACAAVDDVLAWTLLAVVIAIAPKSGCFASGNEAWLVVFAVPFALVVLLVVRPQLKRLTNAYDRAGRLTPGILAFVLLGLLVCAQAADYFGIHFIFGAFLFGAVMPREGAERLRHEIVVRLEQISVLLLLPVFFLVAGLKVDLRGLSGQELLQMGLILVVAIVGKFVGAYVGARTSGVPSWQARALGTLMNTRGLTELVILKVGSDLGLIGPDLFGMLVVMALVTTAMTGPILRRIYPDRRVARDIAEAERAALGDTEARYRVLVVATDLDQTPDMFDLAMGVVADERPAVIVVSRMQPFGSRRLEVGSGLNDDLLAMTESMASLEELVRRGAQTGVTVDIVSRFSNDVDVDLLSQIDAIQPDVVVVSGSGDTVGALVAEAPCRVLVVNDTWPRGTAPQLVEASWGGGDDDAAVVLALRVAAHLGVPLAVGPTSSAGERRVASLIARLRAQGVALADAPVEDAPRWRFGPLSQPDVDLAVRPEVDPAPVDWSTLRVPAAAPVAELAGGPLSADRDDG
jgi:Kef-type K+ transport system membrane component KefB